MSDSIYSLLSFDIRSLCRVVDRVTVKGMCAFLHVMSSPVFACRSCFPHRPFLFNSASLSVLSLFSCISLIYSHYNPSSSLSRTLAYKLKQASAHELVNIFFGFLLDVTLPGTTEPVYLYTYDVPSIKSRGGQLADDINIMDLQISNEDFFTQMAPPSTTLEFRLVHKVCV